MSAEPTSLRGRVPIAGDTVTALAYLPVLTYVVLLSYAAVLYAVLGPNAHPIVLLGVPEVVFGLLFVGILRADGTAVAESGRWTPDGRFWYPLGFLLGATVLASPLVAILYLRSRRKATGDPQRSWLAIVRSQDTTQQPAENT